ncbi:MAG: hypothetical protein RJA81_597 [Planctomycetota bacterium]
MKIFGMNFMEKFHKPHRNRCSRQFSFDSLNSQLEDRNLLSVAQLPLHRKATTVEASQYHQGNRSSQINPGRWRWLTNTYWYVPQYGLKAIEYNSSTGSLSSLQDQTVYHITGYRDGYFWGETVARYGNGSPSSASVVGSVTPQGRVLLTFNNGDEITTGYGVMIRQNGRWAMENQMFTGSSKVQIGHWAYMVQTRPGTRSWRSLPFVNQSVPEFLSNYNLPSPTPNF